MKKGSDIGSRSRSYLLLDSASLKKELIRLQVQAKILFAVEKPVLKQLLGSAPKRILELGCGNGAVTSLLNNEFLEAELLGIDRNQDLIDVAEKLNPTAKFKLLDLLDRDSLSEEILHFQPDMVLLRFVLQHLGRTDSSRLLSFISRSIGAQCRVVIVDADDSKIRTCPEESSILALVKRACEYQEKKGGDRLIAHTVLQMLKENGFRNIKHAEIDVGSVTIGSSNCEKIYLPIWSSGLGEVDSQHGQEVEAAREWFASLKEGGEARLIYPIQMFVANL